MAVAASASATTPGGPASTDVRRHVSTSSQHSDHTLCNEPMAAPPARAAKAAAPATPGVDDASIARCIAAASPPRVEKRPSLMQRFLGAAASMPAPAKRVSPPQSVRSSTSGATSHRRGAGSDVSATFEQKYGTCSR
ncbi:hypothetical protein H4R19_006934, partial [Coemansia spiralis]